MQRLTTWAKAAAGRVGMLISALVALIAVGLLGWLVASAVGLTAHEYAAGAVPAIAGVVAGLPIALWLIGVGEDVAEQRRDEWAAVRRGVVLEVIRTELLDAQKEMETNRALRPRRVVVPFLRAEAWRALADGGELRWIKDPELIGVLARAYHRIETSTTLERAHLELVLNPPPTKVSVGGADPYDPYRLLTEFLEKHDPKTMAFIAEALDAISKDTGAESR